MLFCPVAFFVIKSVPYTAIGLSAAIIGFTALALSTSRPKISVETSFLLFETGMKNIEAVINELELHEKAIYLPPSENTNKIQVVIPLNNKLSLTELKTAVGGKLFVRNFNNNEIIGVLVHSPSTLAIEKLDNKIEPTAEELENILTHILAGVFDLGDSVHVDIRSNTVNVEVGHPELQIEEMRHYESIGSPVASIVAAVVCKALEKPVRIRSETNKKRRSHIFLDVLD